MLDHVPAPQVLPQPTWGSIHQSLAVGPTSRLLKFLLGLIIISGLTCVYLWQASTISSIENETARMGAELAALERENSVLMLQVAQWNAPTYIENKAHKQGLVPAQQPLYVQVPTTVYAHNGANHRQSWDAATLWQQLTGWVPGLAQALNQLPVQLYRGTTNAAQ